MLLSVQGAGGAAHSRAAEHAGALLYRLTFYQTAHADLQAAGCIQALVPLLQSGDARLKRHAVWAIQNLTGGVTFSPLYADTPSLLLLVIFA